jgi:hypothetical protein
MVPTTTHAASAADVSAFMLTLCRLEAPISIRPPPQLARFRFFMSRARHADGNVHLYLHMGYFPTLVDANKWAQVMRARYPKAAVTRTPPGLLPRSGSNTPAGSPVQERPMPEPPVVHGIAPAAAGALTDTQVLQILETRRVHPDELGKPPPPHRPEISLLRPEDTNTRRALKEAVVQGVPISFVVQLLRSNEPIKLGSVPALDIFRAYTLYLAEGSHEGDSWHALRLGFFSDAVSAKQVAHYARLNFATVAVVPINEGERTRASKKPVALAHLAGPPDRSIDELLAADQAQTAAEEQNKRAAATKPVSAPAPPAPSQTRAITTPKQRPKDSLEQTLELLAASELWSNSEPDSLSETGVRHLKVEVQKRPAGTPVKR